MLYKIIRGIRDKLRKFIFWIFIIISFWRFACRTYSVFHHDNITRTALVTVHVIDACTAADARNSSSIDHSRTAHLGFDIVLTPATARRVQPFQCHRYSAAYVRSRVVRTRSAASRVQRTPRRYAPATHVRA